MSNFRGHISAGIISAFIISLVTPTSTIIKMLGSLLCIVGSVFPDIDQKNSIPRKILRAVMPSLLIILYIMLWINDIIKNLSSAIIFGLTFMVFYLIYEKIMPKHRKDLHRLPGFTIYLLITLVIANTLKLGIISSAFLITYAAVGFLTHAVLDNL